MNKTEKLFTKIVKVLKPPPQIVISQWADNERRLSKESSAEAGRWRTSRAPYQREMMDCINDPEVENIVLMTSSQIGKTEIVLNIIGYYMDYDPSPMLLVMPTLDLAEGFSKDRLAPMIRDTPALQNKVKDHKTRDSDNTLLHKKFPGGHVTLVGANSPAGLSSRPIRILLADEVDRFPATAGDEGDPLGLAAKRTKTFWNRKKIYVSTPTIKGESRIEAEYEDGTMEQWHLPCPECGHLQPLKWSQIRFEDVTHECAKCKERFSEFEWKEQTGQWLAQRECQGKRSFHLNALASPWERWENIIEDFRDAKQKGPEVLKVWVNTTLGETWEDDGVQTTEEDLLKRRERYDCDLPDGVLLITAGVDVQDDRLEVEVVGWGTGKASWGIGYQIFYGDPAQKALWDQVDEYLQKSFSYKSGDQLRISCVCVDSGGHYTQEVYKFCKPREHRRIYAVKGKGGKDVPFVGKATRNNREKAALFTLGVDAGKEVLMTRLKVEYEDKPGYCHWPIEKEKGYDSVYFEGLCSEKRVIKYYKGRPKIEWVKKSSVPNEPLDLRNYATAALEILNPDLERMKEENKTGAIYEQTSRKKKRRRVISKGVTG